VRAPPPPAATPRQEKLGFLERQRRNKAARATRRAQSKK